MSLRTLGYCILWFFTNVWASAGERLVVSLKDYTKSEVKGGGFNLPSETQLHIIARGGGAEKTFSSDYDNMYAFGWIIDAVSRDLIWRMELSNTSKSGDDRVFDDWVRLPHGSYEVYFSAHAYAGGTTFSNFSINIDRREKSDPDSKRKKRQFFSWFEDFFGVTFDKNWRERVKDWGIEIRVDDRTQPIPSFTPPRDIPQTMFRAVRLGENEHIKQGFSITKPIPIRIYALGESDNRKVLADYGWIIDTRTRKRVWEMSHSLNRRAGGAEKNIVFRDVITFKEGDYILYYSTDDSHSYLDWNASPPYDPWNYGITLSAVNEADRTSFSLTSVSENKNVIAQLIRMGSDRTESVSFTLKEDVDVRIYAFGERFSSRRQMADYGWIINAKTREKVWTMDVNRTESAGGDEKNRMIDEVIQLPRGTYTIYYQTDDSHAFDDWNASPPFDPEHWGITVSGEGKSFTMNMVEKNVSPKESGIISQIVRAGDNSNRTEPFRLNSPQRVRIYAIGEGKNREMYDYGWIEDASSGRIVWEMTYSMTFHGGGDRKNRMVNTTILLDKGEYRLRYVTDDSHSFNDWNTDPPDDPTMWGITIYEEQHDSR